MLSDAFSQDVPRGISADSDTPPKGGNRSPVVSDFGCGSELAQADGAMSDHQLGSLSDEECSGPGGGHDLLNALRCRGGRPANVQAPFTALPYPLLQLGNDDDLQSHTEATLNLLNNLLGVAIMVMPRAFANVGLLNGFMIMTLMMLANRYTLLVVLKMSMTALDQEPSYPEIGKRVFGRQGLLAVLFSYLLLTGGCLIGMVIGLADTLDQLVHVDAPRWLWVVSAVLLCTPGALLKTLKNVAVLSGVCMLGVITIVAALSAVCLSDVFYAEQRPLSGVGVTLQETAAVVPDDSVHWMLTDPHDIFVTMSIFALQFSIQAGGIEVLTRMAPDADLDASASDGYEPDCLPVAERITKYAYAIAGVLCGTCGMAGYGRFGNEVKGNVLLSFKHDEHVLSLTLIRISYIFVITCSFAFIIVPCRFAAYDLFGLRRRNAAEVASDHISSATFRKTTGCILLVCLVVAMFVTDLAVMFNYVGVWATSAIAFILPCAFQIELRRRQEGIRYTSPDNCLLLLLIFLGMVVVAGNSFEWILDMLGQGGSSSTDVNSIAPAAKALSEAASPVGVVTAAPAAVTAIPQ